jgi:hypothetical protein
MVIIQGTGQCEAPRHRGAGRAQPGLHRRVFARMIAIIDR